MKLHALDEVDAESVHEVADVNVTIPEGPEGVPISVSDTVTVHVAS